MTLDSAKERTPLTPELRRLVELHLIVVRTVLARFQRYVGVTSLDELYAVGYDALVEAAPRYDAARGGFDAFAFVRVRGAMLNHIDAAMKTNKRECSFSSLSPSSDLPEVSLDDFLSTSVNDEQSDVLTSVELSIVGGVMGYYGTRSQTPEEQLSQHQERARAESTLESYVASLGHPQGLIYQRFYRESRPADAIAAELGVSTRTVERTLRTLREQVNAAFIESGIVEAA